MKKISLLIALFALTSIIIHACKKEEVSNQQFVQNYIVGKWPLKKAVNITIKNGDTTVNDTINYGIGTPTTALPIDTMLFTADGKYTKKGQTVTYTIDETGDNISYKTTPAETWHIKYLRLKSIILMQEKTEKIGSDSFIYYKEQQLIK